VGDVFWVGGIEPEAMSDATANSTANTTANHSSRIPPSRGDRARTRRRRWLSVLAGMAGANALWGLSVAVADVDLVVDQAGREATVGPTPVTLASLGVGLVAWLLLELLERAVRRPWLIWRTTACVAFVVSLAGPASATNDAARAVLFGLHILVAGILLIGLGWSRSLATPEKER
jgi:hypothetical protein